MLNAYARALQVVAMADSQAADSAASASEGMRALSESVHSAIRKPQSQPCRKPKRARLESEWQHGLDSDRTDFQFETPEPAESGPDLQSGAAGTGDHSLDGKLSSAGPKTTEDMARMPLEIIWRIFGGKPNTEFRPISTAAQRQRRCFALLERGVSLHHDFGGRQSYEMVFKMLEADLAQLGLKQQWLELFRTTEPIADVSKAILEGKLKPEHQWISIQDAVLDDQMLVYLRRNRPSEKVNGNSDDTLTKKWLEYNKFCKETLEKNKHKFAGACSKKCLVHPGSTCPVRYKYTPEDDPDNDDDRRISVACAGPHCQPWCRYGNQLGEAHPDQESYHVLMREHMEGDYDFVFLEESSDFPIERYAADMSTNGYQVVWATFSPDDLGVPWKRPRTMATSMKSSRIAWLGEGSNDVTASFKKIFARPVGASAAIFKGDSPENALETKKRFAARQGVKKVTANTKLQTVLCPSNKQYLAEFKKIYAAKVLAGSATTEDGFKHLACDLSQNPLHRNRSGFSGPSLMRSSKMALLGPSKQQSGKDGGDHLFTNAELSFAHGWPTLKDVSLKRHQELLNFNIGDLKYTTQASLLGEGMSLTAVEAWVLFTFSHAVWKSDAASSFTPDLHWSGFTACDRHFAENMDEGSNVFFDGDGSDSDSESNATIGPVP